MNYAIVKDGIITNIIVCESEEIASRFGALPIREDVSIGDVYIPPKVAPTIEERVTTLEEALAQTDETAISLYEAQEEQEAINAAQDDALIEIYEMLEG